MDRERPYFAHSTSRPDRADWQLLCEHLHQVAALARERAANFGAGEWGYVAGLLHDLGKYSDGFQARGEMSARDLIVFRHESALGNAPAHELFRRVDARRVVDGAPIRVEEARRNNAPPARRFEDYRVTVDEKDLPTGVTIERRIATGVRRAA